MSEDDEDLILLERWRGGDSRANSELLGRHYKSLHRFFANKVSSDIDDLVQQTMLALLASRERFEQRSSFRAYLLSIARFQLYDYYRRCRRVREVIEYDTVTAFDLSPSPSLQVAQRKEHALLLEALRRIPVNLQIALELHYWEDMSGPEVAEVLGVPVDTAYSRLRKARELVRKQMQLIALRDASAPRDVSAQGSTGAEPDAYALLETIEQELERQRAPR